MSKTEGAEFETATWWKLPMNLRRRYWRETDYGRKPMSAELRGAIDEHMDGLDLGQREHEADG